ncbi:MAG: glycine zipper family protein, partial [Deltaproteobacteria bacterium]|nr:glycine zipper family protein [Deltaproteobacteria bacterium]
MKKVVTKRIVLFAALLLVAGLVAGPTLAQQEELVIYPAQGQSKEQMEKDKFECYTWAKEQTGFDPMETPKATEAPPAQEAPKGGARRGVVRGAAVGAAVGSLDGEMGKGAAVGAAAGGVTGGARRRRQASEQQQAEQQWADEQANQYMQ